MGGVAVFRPRFGDMAMTVRVLLVVPEHNQRTEIRKIILGSDLSTAIVEADSKESAMAAFHNGTFDCVLLFHRLPDGDGESVLLDMVANHNSTAAVIFVIPEYQRELILRVLSTGAAECVTEEQIGDGILEHTFRHAMARQTYLTKLRDLGHYDGLTRLPNRTLFEKEICSAIAQSNRTGRLLVLALINLDDFKHLNERYGHTIGDEILRAAGKRLKDLVRETDFVARIGGDEFAVIAPHVTSAAGATEIGAKLAGAFEEKFDNHGTPLSLSASVGLAVFPVDGRQPMMLMNCADQALYKAKASGRGMYRLFNEAGASTVHALDPATRPPTIRV